MSIKLKLLMTINLAMTDLHNNKPIDLYLGYM